MTLPIRCSFRNLKIATILVWGLVATNCTLKRTEVISDSEIAIEALSKASNYSAQRMRADSRVAAILDGENTEAADALTVVLEKLESYQDKVDPVLYTALIESVLTQDDLSAAEMTSALSKLEVILEMAAQEFEDVGVLIAELPIKAGQKDALVAAVDAYVADATRINVETLVETYWGIHVELQRENESESADSTEDDDTDEATDGDSTTPKTKATVTKAVIFSATKAASSGPDSVEETQAQLEESDDAETGVDPQTETPHKGMATLVSFTDAVYDVYYAAVDKEIETFDGNKMINNFIDMVYDSGDGTFQIAATTGSRTLLSMIASDASVDEMNASIDKLAAVYKDYKELSSAARDAAGDDAEQKDAIDKKLAKMLQSISHISDASEVESASEAIKEVAEAIAAADGDLDAITATINTAQGTLNTSISPVSSGSEEEVPPPLNTTTCAHAEAGDECGGGRFFAEHTVGSNEYRLVATPGGCTDTANPNELSCDGTTDSLADVWSDNNTSLINTSSTTDGHANRQTFRGVGTPDFFSGHVGICSFLEYGGHSDWYLPSEQEFLLLAAQKDAIDGFHVYTGGSPDPYVTSTEHSATEVKGFRINSSGAPTAVNVAKSGQSLARCIRRIAK